MERIRLSLRMDVVNVDEERRTVEEARSREFKFREGEELARRIREATNHGTGVSVVGRKVSLEGGRGPRGIRGARGVSSEAQR